MRPSPRRLMQTCAGSAPHSAGNCHSPKRIEKCRARRHRITCTTLPCLQRSCLRQSLSRAARTTRRAQTRHCFKTSIVLACKRADLRQRHSHCQRRVVKADESAKSHVVSLGCGQRVICDAAGQGRSHEYPPPKKNPVGGKAAIGLTRLPRFPTEIPGGREPMRLASRTHP